MDFRDRQKMKSRIGSDTGKFLEKYFTLILFEVSSKGTKIKERFGEIYQGTFLK